MKFDDKGNLLYTKAERCTKKHYAEIMNMTSNKVTAHKL